MRTTTAFLSIKRALWLLVLQITTTATCGFITRSIHSPIQDLGHSSPTDLRAVSFRTVASLLISDNNIDDTIVERAVATGDPQALIATPEAALDAQQAFTDQIDFFGDSTVQTLFLVFGGVVGVLLGLSFLSSKFDESIANVVDDFEAVLSTDPQFRTKWEEIQPRLEGLDDDYEYVDKGLKRQQTLLVIMEELQEKEPALMNKINAKMGARNQG